MTFKMLSKVFFVVVTAITVTNGHSILPNNENCFPAVSGNCQKGDLIDPSVADCCYTGLITCNAENDGWWDRTVDVDKDCRPCSGHYTFTCGQSGTNSRCVCDDTDALDFFGNRCRCQYWPTASPHTAPPNREHTTPAIATTHATTTPGHTPATTTSGNTPATTTTSNTSATTTTGNTSATTPGNTSTTTTPDHTPAKTTPGHTPVKTTPGNTPAKTTTDNTPTTPSQSTTESPGDKVPIIPIVVPTVLGGVILFILVVVMGCCCVWYCSKKRGYSAIQ